jgi:ribosomal protein S25
VGECDRACEIHAHLKQDIRKAWVERRVCNWKLADRMQIGHNYVQKKPTKWGYLKAEERITWTIVIAHNKIDQGILKEIQAESDNSYITEKGNNANPT